MSQPDENVELGPSPPAVQPEPGPSPPGRAARAGPSAPAVQAEAEPGPDRPAAAELAAPETEQPATRQVERAAPEPEPSPVVAAPVDLAKPEPAEPAAAEPGAPEPAGPEPAGADPAAAGSAEPTSAAEDDLMLTALAEIGARVGDLAEAAAELGRLRTRDTDLISRLHKDVTRLRNGEIASALNPVVTGMIKLHDQMVSLGALNDSASPVGLLHTQLLQIMELTCAVRPFSAPPGERFDAAWHTGTRRIATSDPAADGTVANTIRVGFVRADGSVVRVAEVEVHRLAD